MGAIRNIVTASVLAAGLTVGAAATASAAPVTPGPATQGYVNATWDWSLWPPTGWVKFNSTETSAIVQAGAAGAAAYASATVSQPVLKAAIAAAGVVFWASAKQAVEGSGLCLMVVYTPFTGVLYRGVNCYEGGIGVGMTIEK